MLARPHPDRIEQAARSSAGRRTQGGDGGGRQERRKNKHAWDDGPSVFVPVSKRKGLNEIDRSRRWTQRCSIHNRLMQNKKRAEHRQTKNNFSTSRYQLPVASNV